MAKNTNTNTATEVATLSIEDQVKAIASDTTKNVSVRIRELSALNLKMGAIVKALTAAGYKTKNNTDIRFQHVRNVLTQQPKKAD